MGGLSRRTERQEVRPRRGNGGIIVAPSPEDSGAYPRKASMMTSTEILQLIVAADGYIEVLRGPTAKYTTVYRRDGTVLLEGDLPPEILDDFVKQSFLKQDGEENDEHKTFFRLTTDGKKAGT